MDSRNNSITSKTIRIPTSILTDRKLAVLESITEYLKEKKEMSYHEIAQILNRDDRTIWTVYYRAKKKRKTTATVSVSKTRLTLPSTIFRDRSVAVLESAAEYLKDVKGMTYHEIAVALNRDDRTIWTVYNRAKKKRRHHAGAV